jgi:hypothetical protein
VKTETVCEDLASVWPWKPKHLLSRIGGRIETIKGIGHSHNDWWVVCDVSYPDGGSNKALQLHPGQLCYDGESPEAKEGHAEVCRLGEIVMAYLHEFGDWDERGRWKAKKRKARAA